MGPIKTILYPIDRSECSQAAFRVASALARDSGARLVILEVVPPPVVVYGPPNESYLEEMQKELDQLNVFDPNIQVERRLFEGIPATEILRAAEETHSDLIVMGSRGRGGIRRILLGSVAEAVLRRAVCPVLIVKSPLAPSQFHEKGARVKAGKSSKARQR
jgi:nucleotide-binding universal stress UspA family protein